MPTFPRTILPIEASWPAMTTGLVAKAQSGKTQVRSIVQVGRTWTETYRLMQRSDPVAAAWLAQVLSYFRNQTVVQVDHRALRILRGSPGSAGTVNGANQTGTSIATTGWPTVRTVLKAGDVILLPGRTLVYDVTADVASDGSGNATIPINPPIYAGGSPTSGGAITTNNTPGAVTFRARIAELVMPTAGVNEAYVGAKITFEEMP